MATAYDWLSAPYLPMAVKSTANIPVDVMGALDFYVEPSFIIIIIFIELSQYQIQTNNYYYSLSVYTVDCSQHRLRTMTHIIYILVRDIARVNNLFY